MRPDPLTNYLASTLITNASNTQGKSLFSFLIERGAISIGPINIKLLEQYFGSPITNEALTLKLTRTLANNLYRREMVLEVIAGVPVIKHRPSDG